MTFVEAVVTGLIQGVTEWLPISSKSHLVILPALFGWDPPDLAFITFLHLGTLMGLLVYFARDLGKIAWGARRTGSEERRLVVLVVVATIPAAVFGLLFEATFERLLADPPLVAFSLVATAGILGAAEWRVAAHRRHELARPLREVPLWRDAIGMGIAQTAALLPGVSRSGVTMGAGLVSGLTRPAAARFSFLMAIPVIAGAQVLELPRVAEAGMGGPHWAGFATAVVSGYASVAFLLRFLRTHSFLPFAVYCLVFAIFGGLFLTYAA